MDRRWSKKDPEPKINDFCSATLNYIPVPYICRYFYANTVIREILTVPVPYYCIYQIVLTIFRPIATAGDIK